MTTTPPQQTQTQPPTPRIIEAYHWTDLGNAKRMVARHGADLRYCHPWGSWLVWNGQKWDRDNTAEIWRRAKDAVMMMHTEAANETDDARRRALVLFALKSENTGKLNSMIESAMSEPGIPVLPPELDANPWLFNVQNGTIDLKTGIIRPHQKEDHICKISPVTFDPDAKCPMWLKFLDEIMAGKKEMIEFLKRAAGYALTGDTREECLFILYGSGANGKSKFINILNYIIGEYALKSDIESFLDHKRGSGANNDIARMHGARYVHATEPEEGRNLAEGKIKELTGGDIITARFLYKEGFDFKPQFKLFIGTNYKITIKGTDDGIWRRICMIPFGVKIPKELQDQTLEQKLILEAPGIFNWILQGCLEWQKTGLQPPEDVLSATTEYRNEMDVYNNFFLRCCQFDIKSTTPNKVLYILFKAWCELEGIPTLTHIKFSRLVSKLPVKKIENSKGFAWQGVNLHPELFKAYAQLYDGASSMEVMEVMDVFLITFSQFSHDKKLPEKPPYPPQPPQHNDTFKEELEGMEVCSGNIPQIEGNKLDKGIYALKLKLQESNNPGTIILQAIKLKYDCFNKPDSILDLGRMQETMKLWITTEFEGSEKLNCARIVEDYCHSRMWC